MLGLAEMVKENSGCYRHIQRIRSRNHRYGHPVIRSFRKLWSKTLSFPAQEQSDFFRPMERKKLLATMIRKCGYKFITSFF